MIPELYGEYRPDAVTGGEKHATGRVDQMSVPINMGKPQGPETSWNFFHPGRADVRLAPLTFRRQLHAIDPRLEVSWHPLHERWVCFFRQDDIKFWMCPGWKRLFMIQYPDGAYMPLDERTLGECWSRSPKVHAGEGRKYFERVVIENMRDQKRKEIRSHESDLEARARDQWRFAQIKNIGQGNKFANHEAAD